MKKAAVNRLKNEDGASLVAAILFFVLCGVGASVILAASSASAGKMQQVPVANQKRFAVESAAAFLRDELADQASIVKIKEVMVDDSREEEIQDDIDWYYVGPKKNLQNESSWQPFGTGGSESLLDSMIQELYVPMAENKTTENGTAESENAENETAESTSEKTVTLSVQKENGGSNAGALEQLSSSARISMDTDYQLTAWITDLQTDEEHPEDRCERKLTVPAKIQEDVDVQVETGEDTDEEGNVTDEWEITTTTRLTTIRWERGTIEKTIPGEQEDAK